MVIKRIIPFPQFEITLNDSIKYNEVKKKYVNIR